MKDSQVYLRAAENVYRGRTGASRFSCCAISEAIQEESDFYDDMAPQRERYSELFSMDGNALKAGDVEGAGGKKWRVLALCFMAAIAKSEGR